MNGYFDLSIKKTIHPVFFLILEDTPAQCIECRMLLWHILAQKINVTVLTNIFMFIAPLREVPIRE